jgi:hypothetical protein
MRAHIFNFFIAHDAFFATVGSHRPVVDFPTVLRRPGLLRAQNNNCIAPFLLLPIDFALTFSLIV